MIRAIVNGLFPRGFRPRGPARAPLVAASLLLGLLVLIGGPGRPPGAEEQDDAGAESQAGESGDRKDDGKKAESERAKKAGTKTPPEPLRFTDEDLEKYHRRPPAAPGGARAPDGETSPAPGAAVPPGGTTEASRKPPPLQRPIAPPKPGEARHVPLVRTPIEVARPPSSDPLKGHKDREAREEWRAGQIDGLRRQIADKTARLDYLRQKRIAILNPLVLMPAPPDGSSPEGEGHLKPKELLARVEAEIEALEKDLATLRENLVEIETRFGPEAGLP